MPTGDTLPQTFVQGIVTSLTTQTATWLVAFIIGIFGLFSGYITESIKFALNRADLRTKQYEELATEISQYIFSAELCTEFIEHNWTTKRALTDLIPEYNTSITTLRKKEFVYAAWIQKYWGDQQTSSFNTFMDSLRAFDTTVHSLNDEFEKVNITEEEKKIDSKRADEAMQLMKPAAASLRKKGTGLLMSLR